MSTIAPSRRTNTAVLIHRGKPAAAGRYRRALSAQGLYCADVEVDVGGVLPAPDAAAPAVVVDAEHITPGLDPRVAGWLARAGAAGVEILSVRPGSDDLESALAAAA